MKFDGVKASRAEDLKNHTIKLPIGGNLVDFTCRYVDRRSAEYAAVLNRIAKPYRRRIESGELDAKTDRRIVIEAFVDYALVSWKGLTSDGAPVPFTRDNAIELFTQSPKLFYDLSDEASTLENFSPTEAEVKN